MKFMMLLLYSDSKFLLRDCMSDFLVVKWELLL